MQTSLSGPTRDVAFTAKFDGSTQFYIERLPNNFQANVAHDVMIVLHGHGSDRAQGISDRAEFQAPQDAAAKYGMILVSPDYRAPTSWMGPSAEADMVQIIEGLKQKYKIGKIFLSGASMGGAAALTFAALHPELIDGVCSQNGTANLLLYDEFDEALDAMTTSFGGTRSEVPAEYKKRSAEYWPENFTMPLALAAGGKDELVPPDSVLRLAQVLEKMGRPVQILFREDGGHDTNYSDTLAGLEFVIGAAKVAANNP